MRSILAFASVVLLLVPGWGQEEAAGDGYALRLVWTPGQTSLWRSIRRVVQTTKVGEGTNVLEVIYEERVEPAVAPQTTGVRLRTTVRRVLWSETVDDQLILLDSAAPDPEAQPLPRAVASRWEVLSALIDSPITVPLDHAGRPGEISGLSELASRLASGLASEKSGLTLAQARAALAPAVLLQDMHDHLAWLPTSEVTVGDTWTRNLPLRLLGGMLDARRTMTLVLESVAPVAGSPQAEISLSLATEATSQLESVEIHSATGSGTLRLDLGAGQLQSIELATETQVEVDGDDRTTVVTQRLTPATSADLGPPAKVEDR